MADLLVDVLATYRLARLVIEDELLDEPRAWLHDHLRDRHRLRYLLGCYWCFSIWAAAGVVCARRRAPRAWAPLATVLACSAATGLLHTEH